MSHCVQNNGILLISDDKFIIGLLTGCCVCRDYHLDDISCANFLQNKATDHIYNNILIDTRKMSGSLIEVCLDLLESINHQYHIPVCVIHLAGAIEMLKKHAWIDSCLCEPTTELLGDYLNKVCIQGHNERRNNARRRARERRGGLEINLEEFDNNFCEIGPFKIDRNSQSVAHNGTDLELTTKEFKLFSLLADSFERVCTTDCIIKHLWPETHRATKSDLYQYMHLLRKKVEHDPDNPHWILTVKGVGYKLKI